jgi:hypothetical protein
MWSCLGPPIPTCLTLRVRVRELDATRTSRAVDNADHWQSQLRNPVLNLVIGAAPGGLGVEYDSVS